MKWIIAVVLLATLAGAQRPVSLFYFFFEILFPHHIKVCLNETDVM